MTDLKNLKALIRLMVENDLTELDLQDTRGEKIALKRGQASGTPGTIPIGMGTVVPVPASSAASAPAAPTSPTSDPHAGLTPIPSPMVGTFYASANPEAKPFVKVGDKVGPDTVVCIIEAMKVFNEIKAEVAGTIEKIAGANGKAVEFGQPLFFIRPD